MSSVEPIRHFCSACGACCQGAKVYVRPGEESERIRRIAAELGVEGTVVDDGQWLQRARGRCAFLDDAGLCRIHGAYGSEAKPITCRQYPYVIVETESGRRTGIDPGTTSGIHSWRDGAPITPPDGAGVRPCTLPPDQARAEAVIVALTRQPGATVARVAGALTGQPGHTGPGLPADFACRVVTALQNARIERALAARDCGPFQRRALMPVVEAVYGWDPEAPPPWPDADAADEYALWVLRNTLHLRLATGLPLVQGVALITLVGIVANRWTFADHTDYGRGLSSWAHVMRAAPFWGSIAPDPATMQWLGTGRA